MGVADFFRFRRLLRRGRRVTDGNRHFVIGHDKTGMDANSPPKFPKGSHFFVADSNRLSASELDISNNNDVQSNIGESVVYTVFPQGVTLPSQSSRLTNNVSKSVAVLPTTELVEVNLFGDD